MAKFMLDGQEYCGGGGSNQIVKLTQAEYDALSDEKLSNNTIYLITDSGELTAENLFFDDTETGLGVNNVQDAIVEQNKKIAWNKLSVTGKDVITIPNTAKELSIEMHIQYYGYIVSYSYHHIIDTEISYKQNLTGGMENGSGHKNYYSLFLENNQLYIDILYVNNEDYTSQTTLIVHYR